MPLVGSSGRTDAAHAFVCLFVWILFPASSLRYFVVVAVVCVPFTFSTSDLDTFLAERDIEDGDDVFVQIQFYFLSPERNKR